MLSKTFREKRRELLDKLSPNRSEPCACGHTSENHCKAFPDNVWFGCLKNKLKREEQDEK